jgi:hypothetical protein
MTPSQSRPLYTSYRGNAKGPMVEGAGTGGPVRSTQYSVLSTQGGGGRSSDLGLRTLDFSKIPIDFKTWRPDTDWAAGRAKAPVATLGP